MAGINSFIKYNIIFFMVLIYSMAFSADKNAPLFALFSTDGTLVSLSSEIEKKDVLIVFFAGYCVPCRKEIPELVRLHKKYSNRFNLLFINIDKEGKPEAERILNELGLTTYNCLLDMYQVTVKKYSPSLTIPAFFLVDKKGKIKFQSIGYKPGSINSFENYIKKIYR